MRPAGTTASTSCPELAPSRVPHRLLASSPSTDYVLQRASRVRSDAHRASQHGRIDTQRVSDAEFEYRTTHVIPVTPSDTGPRTRRIELRCIMTKIIEDSNHDGIPDFIEDTVSDAIDTVGEAIGGHHSVTGTKVVPPATSRVYINSARQNQPFDGWTEVQGGGTTDTALAAAAFTTGSTSSAAARTTASTSTPRNRTSRRRVDRGPRRRHHRHGIGGRSV